MKCFSNYFYVKLNIFIMCIDGFCTKANTQVNNEQHKTLIPMQNIRASKTCISNTAHRVLKVSFM